jgi:hypothetical protein
VHKNFGICLLIILNLSVTAIQAQTTKWSEGEHLEIGIDASNQACKALGVTVELCPNQGLFRKDNSMSFQYGELLSAADYYMNPNDFYNDTQTNIAKIIKCAYRQKRYHEAQKKDDLEYPSCTMTGLFSMPGYLEVLSHNYNHFGWNNMLAYVEFHGQALEIAKLSFEKKETNPNLSKQLLHKAIIFNAFADHYLSDAFASGHIRVPRAQIKNWARKQLPGLLKSSRGDLLSMLLHNFESVNPRTGLEMGFRVQNSLGNVWLTRSDERLNLYSNKKDLTVLLPKKAVEESFKDILIAAEYGDLPYGIYRAAQFVPFQYDMPLIDKLSPEHQQVKRQSDVVSLFFLSTPMFQRFFFYKSDFAKMLDALSSIFLKFRQDIAYDQATNPELTKRLPEKYLQAYLNVE